MFHSSKIALSQKFRIQPHLESNGKFLLFHCLRMSWVHFWAVYFKKIDAHLRNQWFENVFSISARIIWWILVLVNFFFCSEKVFLVWWFWLKINGRANCLWKIWCTELCCAASSSWPFWLRDFFLNLAGCQESVDFMFVFLNLLYI